MHCCAREAITGLLASAEDFDPSVVREAATQIVVWAGELGSPGALEQRAELTLSGKIRPAEALGVLADAYFNMRLAAQQFHAGQSDRIYRRKEDAAGEARARTAADALKAKLEPAALAAAEAATTAWTAKGFDALPSWLAPPSPPPTR